MSRASLRATVRRRKGDFELDVAIELAGHVTGLVGASGAGKSTLLALIAGLETPDAGTITVGDETLFDAERAIHVPAHRRRVGVAFQESRLFPHRTVRGNLLYGVPPGGSAAKRRRRLDQVIDVFELGRLLERLPVGLSGGERQRVALARALLSQPRLLLLDEPLASLDVRLKRQVLPYLRRIPALCTAPMLYVSHDLAEVLQLTDRLIVLERGRVAGAGRFGDLVHDAGAFAALHDAGCSNVFDARVMGHEAADGVTILGLGAGKSRAPLVTAPLGREAIGERLAIALSPSDVALASAAVGAVSIQNQLPGVVARCTRHERAVVVEVDIGVPLLAEVSRRAASMLELAPGRPIVCLVKSQSIRRMWPTLDTAGRGSSSSDGTADTRAS